MFTTNTKNKLTLSEVTPYLTIELSINNDSDYAEIKNWLESKYIKQQYSYTGRLYLIDKSIASFAFLTHDTLSIIAIFKEKVEVGSINIDEILSNINKHLIKTVNLITEYNPSLAPNIVTLDLSKKSGA